MNFTFYLDECGDQGLAKVDPGFPVFVLCGVLFDNVDYNAFCELVDALKNEFFGRSNVILHSRDIRKCEKEFCILLNGDVKSAFYKQINDIISESQYTIITAAIDKNAYCSKYTSAGPDPYDIALSFVVERMVFLLEGLKLKSREVLIVIEKRGKKEDRMLAQHFETIRNKGTYYVSKARMAGCNISIEFRDKKQNIAGLQLADLIAYPVARRVMDRCAENASFEIFQNKIYQKNGKLYGLKIFP